MLPVFSLQDFFYFNVRNSFFAVMILALISPLNHPLCGVENLYARVYVKIRPAGIMRLKRRHSRLFCVRILKKPLSVSHRRHLIPSKKAASCFRKTAFWMLLWGLTHITRGQSRSDDQLVVLRSGIFRHKYDEHNRDEQYLSLIHI